MRDLGAHIVFFKAISSRCTMTSKTGPRSFKRLLFILNSLLQPTPAPRGGSHR